MRCGVVCFNMIKIFWYIQRNSNLYVGKETSTVLSFDEKRLFQKQIEIVGLVAEAAGRPRPESDVYPALDRKSVV